MGDFDYSHKIGIADGLEQELSDSLLSAFYDECGKVGIYLAMARQADREGFPEIAEAFKRYATEDGENAGIIAEMIGGVLVSGNTKDNITTRIDAEILGCKSKAELADKLKEAGKTDIYNTLMEITKDVSRHGQSFVNVAKRYFEPKK